MSDAQEFFKKSEPLFRFYEEGRFADALAVAEKLAAEFPDQGAKTFFWRVCLHSVSGQHEQALRAFEEALANEVWWSEGQLRSDPDLNSLQGDPEFECLVLLSKEKHMNAQVNAKPELFVYPPDGNGPFPLLIALHARGSSPELDFHFWKSAVEYGWILAMPQSSQLASPLVYLWDDREKAMNEIAEHITSLIEKHPVDADRIVVAGFSQGAARAMQLVLSKRVHAHGFLAVVPAAMDLDELNGWAGSGAVRGVLVSGGRDPRHEFFQQVREIFANKNVPLIFEHYLEMSHEFPDDFETVLKKGLHFILKEHRNE